MKLKTHIIFLLSFCSLSFCDIPFFLTSKKHNLNINELIKDSFTNPCTNFYEYSCSNWKAETVKPDFEPSWSHFTAAAYNIKKKIQFILESPENNSLIKKAQTFYNACINFEEHQDQYLVELKMLISYFKGWPVVEQNWSANGYNWLEEVALISIKLGFHPLLKFHIGIDYKNTGKYILYIEPGNLIFPINILLNPSQFVKELSSYEEWLLKTAQYLFPNNSNRNLKQDVLNIVNFEIELAKFMSNKSKMERNSLEYFSKKFNINFRRIFDIFHLKYLPQKIVIRNYGYFKNLVAFTKRINVRKIANYIIWTIIKEFSRDTTIYLKKLNYAIDKTVLGITSDISRKLECTNKAIDYFSYALLPKYMDLYLNNNIITSVKEMTKNIKNEFINLVKQNTWLSNETRILAIDKIKAIQCVVGFSDWMSNKTELEEYYDKITVSEHHFKNLIMVKQLKIEKNLLLLGRKVNIPLWPSNIFDANAYYSILQNLVFVPLGILQEPFYHENGPNIFNYGALGSLIGHEFSHSLDTTVILAGREANSKGNIIKWWPAKDILEYKLKSQCFESIKQPTNILLIGENIADNVGLDISYKAYKNLNDFDILLWSEKIFFFSYAQMWCEISDQLDLFSDEHTSVKIRVNQAASNNKYFNKIFNCHLKNNICKLW